MKSDLLELLREADAKLINDVRDDMQKDIDLMLRHIKWKKRYMTKPIVDINKHFSKEEIEILQKLGVTILDKLYTEYEFDVYVDMQTIQYYIPDDLTAEELEEIKREGPHLEDTGVSKEELDSILDKVSEVNKFYNF